MGHESYMMFNVTHSSQPNVRSATGSIDYAEREEMADIENEIKFIKEKSTGIDYIERQRTSDTLDLEGKTKLLQDYKSDFVTSKSFNLPAWSEGKDVRPSKYFFRSSEKNEPAGWNNYHEFKIAIPNETTDEQAMKLGVKIMNKSGFGKNAYTIAIHDKEASLSFDGTRNRHLHIVFSDRIQDGIERTEEQYFKSYAHVNKKRGGCKKDTRFTVGIKKVIENTKEIRRNVADVINEFYKENNINKSVDARTNEELLAEAIKNKDYNLIELLSVEQQERLSVYKTQLIKDPESFKVASLKTQDAIIKVLDIKERRQAIKDRQIIDEMKSQKLNDNVIEELPSAKELERQIAECNLYINKITDRIQSKIDVAKEIIKTDITGVKALHLDITIENKTRAICQPANIEKACVREYMSSIKKLPEFLEYDKNLRSLSWHKKQIAENENKLKSIKLSDRRELNITTNRIAALERTVLTLENNIVDFKKKYINKNSKLEEFKPQIIANNLVLENYITTLKNRKKELLSPFLKDIVADRELLADEYNKFNEVKKAYLEKGEPAKNEPAEIAKWEKRLESFDEIEKVFKEKEKIIEEKSIEKIKKTEEQNNGKHIIERPPGFNKPNIKRNGGKRPSQNGMCNLSELDMVWNCKNLDMLLPCDDTVELGNQDAKSTDEMRRNISETGLNLTTSETIITTNEAIKNLDKQCEFFYSDGITTSQALQATLDEIKKLKTEINYIEENLKNINSKIISKSNAEKTAREIYIGSPLKEAQKEQIEIRKEEKSIQLAKEQYNKNTYAFSQMTKPKWNQFSYATTYKEAEKTLQIEGNTLTKRESTLANRKTNNDKQFFYIDLKCKTPDACVKIGKMVEDILVVNKTLSTESSKLSTTKKDLNKELNCFTKMKTTFEKQIKFETTQNKKTKSPERVHVAKVTPNRNGGGGGSGGGNASNNDLLKALATAMGAFLPKDSSVAAISPKMDDNNEYDWEWMSPLAIEQAIKELKIKNGI